MTPRQREQALAAVASSPQAFRQALLIDADGQSKRLAEVIDPWQQADFEAVDPAWQAIAHGKPMPDRRRAWFERPRGHSKTGDIAAMVSFCLAGSPRQLLGVVAAADSEQAGLIRDAIGGLCSLNWWLNDALEVQRGRVINRRTNSELRILSADAPSSYGLTPDFVVCDEVTHWAKRDLWDSLFSAAAKKGRCLLAVICNAGFEGTWQWPLREAIRTDPNWHFARLDGPQASWITEDRLAEQRRLLPPIAYRRLWLNEWSSGSGDALEEGDVAAACTLRGPAGPELGYLYVAGVDLGLKRDASAIALLGKHVGYTQIHRPAGQPEQPPPLPLATRWALSRGEIGESDLTDLAKCRSIEIRGTGRVKLAGLKVFAPGANGSTTVDVSSIEAALLELHARYKLAAIACDPWQARYLIERLQRAGVPIEPVDFVGANLKSMAEATLSAFSERLIDVWPDPTLLADLRSLRVVEKQYGIRLESPRKAGGEGTRHGDTATGLSLALHVARRFAFHPAAALSRELICYP